METLTLDDLVKLIVECRQAKIRCSDENGLHCHTCPSCQTVWQHPTPPDSLSKACRDRWHECPRCRTPQRVKTKLADVTHIDYPWEGGNG